MRAIHVGALVASATMLGCFVPKSVTVRAADAATEGAVADARDDVALDGGSDTSEPDGQPDASDAASEAAAEVGLEATVEAGEPDAPALDAPDAGDALDVLEASTDALDAMALDTHEAGFDAPFDAPSDGPFDASDASDAGPGDTSDARDASDGGDAAPACPRPEQTRCREVIDGMEELNCRDIEYGIRASSSVPITNCGACGRTCATTSDICIYGECCLNRTAFCPPPPGSDPSTLIQTQLQADANNCGACGNRCGNLETCGCGRCRCVVGYTSCGGACVDTSTSAAHCGACGNACGSGEACVRGRCAAAPANPQSCAEARLTTEGPHTLYFANDRAKPYQAFCDDFATGPTTWLALTGDSSHNYVFAPRWVTETRTGYVTAPAGTTMFGPGLLTIYDRVRFEPENARIVISDTRRSRSMGSEKFNTAAWFGLPSDCNWSMPAPRAIGRANVDLAGTPFSLVSTWIPRGFFEQGETLRSTLRSVDVTGGGHCGANYPDGFDYPNRALYIRVGYAP